MAIERRRPRPPRKPPHPKRRRHKRREKRSAKKKKSTGTKQPPHQIDSGGQPGGGGGQADSSAVVATPGNTGTDQGMTTEATPASLTGQQPQADTSGGYFSTGPGAAEHYHPVATFVNVIAEHTDETTTDAGSTGTVASSSGTENNPT